MWEVKFTPLRARKKKVRRERMGFPGPFQSLHHHCQHTKEGTNEPSFLHEDEDQAFSTWTFRGTFSHPD